ncbi:hypothetical protein ACEQ8H_002904 [Pleosporales sp. CAS-2024a]
MGRHKTKDIDWLVKRMNTLHVADDAATTNHDSEPSQPFRFFDLPSELRLRVYELLLVFPSTLDLDPANVRHIAPYMRLFTVSRQMHDEATRVFYARNTFRVFPIHGRYINKKHPLLAWLPRKHRVLITRLELRLGPGFTSPPKHWVVDSRLGLAATTHVYKLRIFIEMDPSSHPSFDEWVVARNHYTEYCVGLVRALLAQIPSVSEVEFDAYPAVKKTSPLLIGLVDEAKLNQKRVTWGDERGWDTIVDKDLAGVLQKLGIEGL